MKDENIKKMIEWAESSCEFFKGQIPDYIQQFLQAELIISWLNVVILAIGFTSFFLLWIWCMQKQSAYKCSYEVPTLIAGGTVIPAIMLLPIVCGLISQMHNLIYIYVSPKVYVLNHLTSLLK